MKIILISDTHGSHEELKLPKGDMIIHGGDITGRSTLNQTKSFLEWFSKLSFKYKILVPGNHDFLFEKSEMIEEFFDGIHVLIDQEIEIEGIRIWGSPVTPIFFNWAFMKARGEELKEHWKLIPEDLDILVTHGPPYKILDLCPGGYVGCEDLRNRLQEMENPPTFHLFGHIHESYGKIKIGKTTYINMSVLDGNYRLRNTPKIINIKK